MKIIQIVRNGMEKKTKQKNFMTMKTKLGQQYLYLEKQTKYTAIVRDELGPYMMIEEAIQQEDVTLVNMYAPNTAPP